jgi:plasminogen activator inhibitor 1 RNA-binding protein
MSNFFAALDDSGDEGRGPAPAASNKKKTAASSTKKEVVEPSKIDLTKAPNKNNRGTKGGRGGRPPVRQGKREFDRRSGTGRGRETKKEGGGGHNWGNDKNDAKKAEGPVTEGEEEANTPENVGGEGKDDEEEAVEEEQPPEEPEDKTLSYDEYLQQKARPDSDLFKPMAVREVENEFAGKMGARKEEEDFLVMGGGKSLKKKGVKKEEKQSLVLDFKVKSAISDDRGGGGRRDGGRRDGGRRDSGRDRRDGGGRGGRGGDRGGRRDRGSGSGRGRGGKGLDTTDANAFPSL